MTLFFFENKLYKVLIDIAKLLEQDLVFQESHPKQRPLNTRLREKCKKNLERLEIERIPFQTDNPQNKVMGKYKKLF